MTRPNEVWSMEFVMDSLANARRLKCLTVADDFSRESIDITVDHGISGSYVCVCSNRQHCFEVTLMRFEPIADRALLVGHFWDGRTQRESNTF